jgi:protein-S-isoprenylcysteine O-methyltransferase Ste14
VGTVAAGFKGFEKTKLYDLVAALPLIGFFGWNLWRLWPELVTRYYILRFGYIDLRVAAEAAGLFLTVLFLALLIALLLVRRVPIAKGSGVVPRFAAVGGTFLGIAFLSVPAAELPTWLAVTATLLIAVGTFGTIIALAWLGRSFSIMPEARRLVTGGPYAAVRHPVYLCEEVTLFGIMLQHAQPWSLLLFAAQFLLQLARMHYEERVLAASFPDYAAYAARKARLIPGVY